MAADTPDRGGPFEAERTAEMLDDYFRGANVPVRRIARAELSTTHPHASAAWRVSLPTGNGTQVLHLVIDAEAPFSRPSVYLANRPPAGTLPHVESDGRLCLATDATATVSRPIERIRDVVDDLLRDAHALLKDVQLGRLDDDFLAEWPRYWVLGERVSEAPVLSLVELRPPSRVVSVATWRQYHVVAETPDTLEQWVQNKDGRPLKYAPSAAPLILLSKPLAPNEYPRGIGDLVELARREGHVAVTTLRSVAAAGPRPLVGLLAHAGGQTPTVVGFEVTQPGGKTAHAMRGFRPGHVPDALRTQRYLDNAPVLRRRADRADPSWVHGRDLNRDLVRLRDVKVVAIGCGSLGGGVARLLVQAGVGHLSLVDDDVLDWSNSSRHVLGADAATQRKASALAERLRREFPHASIEAFDDRWQEVLRRGVPLFDKVDLVVAATGDWSAEAALNDLQHQDGALGDAPIVYGWLERFGHAVHAVLLRRGRPCLRCGFTATGALRIPVAQSPDATTDARCGDPQSPHGATAVVLAQAIVGDLCLDALANRVATGVHRVWITPATRLGQGTTWNEGWCAAHGNPADGGRLLDVPWRSDPTCPTCRADWT